MSKADSLPQAYVANELNGMPQLLQPDTSCADFQMQLLTPTAACCLACWCGQGAIPSHASEKEVINDSTFCSAKVLRGVSQGCVRRRLQPEQQQHCLCCPCRRGVHQRRPAPLVCPVRAQAPLKQPLGGLRTIVPAVPYSRDVVPLVASELCAETGSSIHTWARAGGSAHRALENTSIGIRWALRTRQSVTDHGPLGWTQTFGSTQQAWHPGQGITCKPSSERPRPRAPHSCRWRLSQLQPWPAPQGMQRGRPWLPQ